MDSLILLKILNELLCENMPLGDRNTVPVANSIGFLVLEGDTRSHFGRPMSSAKLLQ